MIVPDGELSTWGEIQVGDLGNEECELCGRSIVTRFGGIAGTTECPSCTSDFRRLNAARKLEFV